MHNFMPLHANMFPEDIGAFFPPRAPAREAAPAGAPVAERPRAPMFPEDIGPVFRPRAPAREATPERPPAAERPRARQVRPRGNGLLRDMDVDNIIQGQGRLRPRRWRAFL